jgi:hypothetical protein
MAKQFAKSIAIDLTVPERVKWSGVIPRPRETCMPLPMHGKIV